MPLKPDPSITPVTLVTDDGMMFHCWAAWIGRHAERRWMFVDRDGVDYVGPQYPTNVPEPAVDELRAIVNEFWTTKRALGQAGMNARLFHRRLMSFDN